VLCIAEVSGMNVAGLEVVNDAKLQSGEADGTETVERGTRRGNRCGGALAGRVLDS